jgi:hydrogenase maturation protease
MKIAVIGIGQSMRGDDAAGLEAVRLWQEKYPETANLPGVRVEVSENPGLALLDLLDGSDAVVLVDAVSSTTKPGTLHRLSLDRLSSFTADSKSAHGWGVAETLQMDQLLNPTRQIIPIRVIGIEAEQFQMGRGLSAAIDQVLPNVCEVIDEEVRTFINK